MLSLNAYSPPPLSLSLPSPQTQRKNCSTGWVVFYTRVHMHVYICTYICTYTRTQYTRTHTPYTQPHTCATAIHCVPQRVRCMPTLCTNPINRVWQPFLAAVKVDSVWLQGYCQGFQFDRLQMHARRHYKVQPPLSA